MHLANVPLMHVRVPGVVNEPKQGGSFAVKVNEQVSGGTPSSTLPSQSLSIPSQTSVSALLSATHSPVAQSIVPVEHGPLPPVWQTSCSTHFFLQAPVSH